MKTSEVNNLKVLISVSWSYLIENKRYILYSLLILITPISELFQNTLNLDYTYSSIVVYGIAITFFYQLRWSVPKTIYFKIGIITILPLINIFIGLFSWFVDTTITESINTLKDKGILLHYIKNNLPVLIYFIVSPIVQIIILEKIRSASTQSWHT